MLATIWGLSFLFVSIGLRALAPVWIVTARTVVGGLVLAVVLAISRGRFPRRLRTWRHLAVLAATSNALPWSLIAWAQQSIPSGLAALVMALVPSATLALSVAIGIERRTPARIAGLALSLAGVVLIVIEDLSDAARAWGVLATVAAAMLYAVSGVYAKRYISGAARPLEIAASQVLCAAAFMVPVSLVFAPAPRWAAVDGAVVGAVLALGAVGTGVAYIVLYRLIERSGATNTSLVAYLIPLVAVIAGAVVLGERLGIAALLGGGLVVAGIWTAQRTSPPPSDLDQVASRPR